MLLPSSLVQQGAPGQEPTFQKTLQFRVTSPQISHHWNGDIWRVTRPETWEWCWLPSPLLSHFSLTLNGAVWNLNSCLSSPGVELLPTSRTRCSGLGPQSGDKVG